MLHAKEALRGIMTSYDFDIIIIGSGFGGSVAALRLAEQGYRVGLLEMGKRYRPQDFPKSTWRLRKFIWFPTWGLHGFVRMSLFRHLWVLSGVGVGGGSLAYANVLHQPPASVWSEPGWAGLQDWSQLLPPFYDRARRMLGVTTPPELGRADHLLRRAAERQGVGASFRPAPVGVYFGPPDQITPDPYFGGAGPPRSGCVGCGGCLVGCRYGAKNTLDQNYLYLAEKLGAQIIPETTVVSLTPLAGRADGQAGYEIGTIRSSGRPFQKGRRYRARGVVLAAGVLGTVKLLLTMKQNGSLPHLSDRVGQAVRTNAETILGVRLHDRQADVTEGVTIGAGVDLDPHTHLQIFRYPQGSDSPALLAAPLTGRAWWQSLLTNPLRYLRTINPRHFATTTLNLLVMQQTDSQLQLRLNPTLLGPKLTTAGPRLPAHIPQATAFARRMAAQFGGTPVTALTEVLFGVPTTAHLLGGAVMGHSPETGVIDARGRVFNYRNLLICDGSLIGANLGVNPALTITALAEYIFSEFVDEF